MVTDAMLSHGPASLFVYGRNVITSSSRSVSSKYPRPTPRPYRRRLFEAALQPILPKQVQVCVPPGLVHKRTIEESKEYSDVEIALSDLVKKWMINEEYRVLAVCQFMPVPGRTLWLAKNQMRLKGLEFRNYGNKIIQRVFEGTPLSSLNVTLVGSNALLLGKDIADIKNIVAETEKLNWIVPLVMAVDSRVVSMVEARRLAELRSMEDVRAETVQILTTQLGQLPVTLDAQSRELTSSLAHIANSPL